MELIIRFDAAKGGIYPVTARLGEEKAKGSFKPPFGRKGLEKLHRMTWGVPSRPYEERIPARAALDELAKDYGGRLFSALFATRELKALYRRAIEGRARTRSMLLRPSRG